MIKNRTSGVDCFKTVARIENLLAQIGAKSIGKDYDAGKLTNITFQLQMDGRDFLIRLPCNEEAVYEALASEVRKPHKGTMAKLKEQASRTAWKIQQEWLEIELTLLRLRQKEPMQIFMAYVWNGERTFYAHLKETKFKGLLAAPKEQT